MYPVRNARDSSPVATRTRFRRAMADLADQSNVHHGSEDEASLSDVVHASNLDGNQPDGTGPDSTAATDGAEENPNPPDRADRVAVYNLPPPDPPAPGAGLDAPQDLLGIFS